MKLKNLPDLILLSDFNGNWHSYIEAVYQIFQNDFFEHKPRFRGTCLRLKRHPVQNGKEYTFYHITHAGHDEHNRVPDLRRCERIRWAKPSIENCDRWRLKVWPQKRRGEDRICIWLEVENDLDYCVILNWRKGYLLLWTAFTLEYVHEKKKKLKEYEAWLKTTEGAEQNPTPS